MGYEQQAEGLARRLRLAREQAGLSQGQVAKMLGLHRPAVSGIEAGRRRVSAAELGELSKIYDVSLTWLVSGDSSIDTEQADRIQLAARQLSKLKPEDIDMVLRLLRTLRRPGDSD